MGKSLDNIDSIQKINEKHLENDKTLNNSETLLLKSTNEDERILEKLNIDHEKKYAEKKKEPIDKLNFNRNRYNNKKAYLGTDIKQFCIDNGYLLLPIEYYIGTVPDDLAKTIRDFIKINEIDDIKINNVFYILAPEEAFTRDNYNKEGIEIVKCTPTLFYKEASGTSSRLETAREKDVFVEVKDWNNKIGNFRFLVPYFSGNYHQFINTETCFPSANFAFIIILFLFGIFSLLIGWSFWIILITYLIMLIPMNILKSKLKYYTWNEKY